MICLICTLEQSKIEWLPQFVRHYRGLGVEKFLLTLQQEPHLEASEIAGHFARFSQMLAALGIDGGSSLVESYDSSVLKRHHRFLQDSLVSRQDWVVWTDSDEFQVYPYRLDAIVPILDRNGVQLVNGYMIDRIAADGTLPPFNPQASIWETYPIACLLSEPLSGAQVRKVALARGDVRMDTGNHRPDGGNSYRISSQWVQIHHFKWHGGVIDTLEFRMRPEWQEKCAWWVESQRFYDYLRTNDWKFREQDILTTRLPFGTPSELLEA